MKKIFLAVLILCSISVFSQTTPANYTNIAQRYDWLAGLFRSLGLPAGGSAAFQPGQAPRAGSVFYDSTGVDAGAYLWNGLAWVSFGGGGGSQTFQQVLTAGSTLTGDNTIAGDGFAYNHLNSRIFLSSPNNNYIDFEDAATGNMTLGANAGDLILSSNDSIKAINTLYTNEIYIALTKRLRLGSNAGDLSDPENGDMFYNSTTNKFRGYENGAWLDMINGTGGTVETASSGLQKVGNDIRLGVNALVANTEIPTSAFYLRFNSSTSNAGTIVGVNTADAPGVSGIGTNGNGVHGSSTNLHGIAGTTIDGPAGIWGSANPASNSTVVAILELNRFTTGGGGIGTGANGMGGAIKFKARTAAQTNVITHELISKWADATGQSADFELWGRNVAVHARKIAIAANGDFTIDGLAGLGAGSVGVDNNGKLVWQTSTAPFAYIGQDFLISNDSLKMQDWISLKDYATGDGVTDDIAGVLTAISTGKNILVTDTFLVEGSANTILLALNVGQKMMGLNRETSILKTTSNARIIAMQPFSSISHLGFLGSGSKTTTNLEFQTGIVASTNDTGWTIQNVTLRNFGGTDTYVGGAIYVAAIVSGATMGATMNNINIYNSRNGLSLGSRAEYLNLSNIKIVSSHVGMYNAAGNVEPNGFTIIDCDTAYKQFGGTNNGHAVFSNSFFNHNTYNLVVDGITNGQLFKGIMMYAGDVIIRNSTGIRFDGCDFSTGNITLTNNTNLYRSGRWKTMTESIASGEGFNVLGETKTDAGAVPWIDQYSTIDTVRFRGPMIHAGITPASASGSDSVWVKDATTGQSKLRSQSDIAGGGATFEALPDGPGSFTGQAGKASRVNITEDALEYYTPSGSIPGQYLITLTSGTTWTTPADITTATRFKITMTGGAGAGGGSNNANSKASGGGAAGSLIVYVTNLSPSTGYSYVIGQGGTGGTGAPTVGGNGTATTLTIAATTYTCNPGLGGNTTTTAGTGGTAVNGDINITGQTGWAAASGASASVPGVGGGSPAFGLGIGAPPIGLVGNGLPGTGFGSGGGGGVGLAASGGNGTNGIIIIEYIN